MEPIFYCLTYGCWLTYCWLMTNAKNQPIPPPSRFNRKVVSRKQTIRPRCQRFWF